MVGLLVIWLVGMLVKNKKIETRSWGWLGWRLVFWLFFWLVKLVGSIGWLVGWFVGWLVTLVGWNAG